MTPKEVVQKGYDCFASGEKQIFIPKGKTMVRHCHVIGGYLCKA